MSDEEKTDPESSAETPDTATETKSAPAKPKAQQGKKAKKAKKPKKKEPTLKDNVIFVLGFLVMLAGGYWVGQKAIEYFRPVDLEEGDRYRAHLRGDEPQRGPNDALVTIVEYSDFQCPFCGQAAGPLEEAIEAYEDDVRLIFKHYPLPNHNLALPAARAAWAAHQQGRFWPMHDWLFEVKGNFENYPTKVPELGIELERFRADMEGPESLAAVDDDMLSGGKAGASGTPYFLVNGHPYSGMMPTATWKKIIRHELGLAEDLVDAGTPRAEVYDRLMENAKEVRGGGSPVGGKPSERPAAQRRPGEPDPMVAYRVTTDDRPQMGPDDALVTIIEFADYHCPYCARVSAAVRTVQSKYPTDVRVVYRQFPLVALHPHAKSASAAALAAGRQGKFWEMHEALFESQASNERRYRQLAAELGLDEERLVADMKDPALLAQIDEDLALGQKFGVRSTPSFFVNGRFVRGAVTAPQLDGIVAGELEKAKARLGAGVPRAKVYETILSEAEATVQ